MKLILKILFGLFLCFGRGFLSGFFWSGRFFSFGLFGSWLFGLCLGLGLLGFFFLYLSFFGRRFSGFGRGSGFLGDRLLILGFRRCLFAGLQTFRFNAFDFNRCILLAVSLLAAISFAAFKFKNDNNRSLLPDIEKS